MSAIFTIDQVGLPAGTADRARRDILAGGPVVQFAAVFPPPNHTTYAWEFLSQPNGVVLVFSDPTIHNPTVNFGSNYGGYLVKLTVDVGLPTEDVSIRYVGMPWPISGLAVPALNETIFDNSQVPFDGKRGWEEKLLSFMWWAEMHGVPPSATNNIYVDADNGSDVFGDGSINGPYQTLQFAVSTVAVPTNWGEFNQGLEFVLSPGVYAGASITLPYRRIVAINGDRYTLSCDVIWGYDTTYWYTHSDVTYPPQLGITTTSPLLSTVRADITRVNANPLSVSVSETAVLLLQDVQIGGSIRNVASGGAVPTTQTGRGVLKLRNVISEVTTPTSYIGGERETHVGMEAYDNAWIHYWEDVRLSSAHNVTGCNQIVKWEGCVVASLRLAYDRDVYGAGGYAGHLGGYPGFSRIMNSVLSGGIAPKFGWDGITGTEPGIVAFDSPSWRSTITYNNYVVNVPGYTFLDRSVYVAADAGSHFLVDGTVQQSLEDLESAIMTSGGGVNAVYVDETNGNDVTGDGSQVYPYRTFPAACASVVTANPAEYVIPVQFILRPGLYPGGATLPDRQSILITGDRFHLSSNVTWQHSEAYCALVDHFKSCYLSTTTPLDSSVSGDWVSKRIGFVGGGPPATFHSLGFRDVYLDAFSLNNTATGTGAANENTGRILFLLDGVRCPEAPVGSVKLGGSYELATDDNGIYLYITGCRLDQYINGFQLFGVGGIEAIVDTAIKLGVDYTLDFAGTPYTGSIGGGQVFKYEIGVVNSAIQAAVDVKFGWNGAAPFSPSELRADSRALHALEDNYTFTNFSGLGHRRWVTASDRLEQSAGWPSDSTVIVERGMDDDVSGSNLLSAYARAVLLTPGGNPLSATNRATVLIPYGGYNVSPSVLTLNTDYVDLIGVPNGMNSDVPAGAVITNTADLAVQQMVADVRLANIRFVTADMVGSMAMDIQVANADSQYTNLNFEAIANLVSVGTNAAISISGHWENVHSVQGILAGTFSGTARNCSGGDFSFGGSAGGAIDGVFSGTAWNCTGGTYSFGANNAGAAANGTCSGTLFDCTAGAHSFGSVDGAGNGTFSGTAWRCLSGGYSFGYSAAGAAAISGDLYYCEGIGEYVFGASDSGNSEVEATRTLYACSVTGRKCFGYSRLGAAIFSGTAQKCSATLGEAFACSQGTGAWFRGIADQCTGGRYAFAYAAGHGAFAYDAYLDGTVTRCVADGNSYGSSTGVGVTAGCSASVIISDCTGLDDCYGSSSAEAVFAGVALDSRGGSRCWGYGSNNTGATVTFSGTAFRCFATGNSFGAGYGTAPAVFSGRTYDCTSGNCSFGYSYDALVTFTGKVIRCDSGGYSFACSGSGMPPGATTGGSVDVTDAIFQDCVSSVGASFGVTLGDTGADSIIITDSRFERCKSLGPASFVIANAGDVTVNSGSCFVDCESSDYSYAFCNGSLGAAGSIVAGTFRRCTGGDGSFCVSVSNNATFNGTFELCVAGDHAFCATADATDTYVAEFSGNAYDCRADANAFGVAYNGGLSATLSGRLYRCISGDFSFGYSAAGVGLGVCSGYLEDCTAGDSSFGGQVSGGVSGTLMRCRRIDPAGSAILLDSGARLIDCQFSASSYVLTILAAGTTPQIYKCLLYSTGADPTIYSAGAVDARIAHCIMNTNADANVTNLIIDGYNVVDPAVGGF